MNNSRRENKIIFICWLAYAVAYVGRVNFAASIVAIIPDMQITKEQAGLVTSCLFFAYGIGQLVNGILSKRYNNRIMVFISLFVSSWLNLLVPLVNNINVIKYIWLLNGAVQSILWCTLIKTISENVSEQRFNKAIVAMSTPVAAGTIGAYGLSALFVKFSTWRTTFYVAFAMLLIASFIWFILYGNEKEPYKITKAEEKESRHKIPSYMYLILFTIAVSAIANGFIKDGINVWTSSVLVEKFNVTESFSILITLLLPLISLIGATFVAAIHKKIKSHSMMDLTFYAITLVVSVLSIVSLKYSKIVPLIGTFIVISCLMAMVNNVITSVFPLERRKLLGSGFLAGLINTFCYVGSTSASYGLAVVQEKFGWNMVLTVVLIVCGVAVATSAVGTFAEKKENKVIA
ncbi:MAG: MFS transporter [Clostridia bacterium]|nr:MFS transporter [Clostridia bacterium]